MALKILIIQTAFLGDVVLATAVPEKLHQFFPDAQLDFMLRKGNEGLLANHPYLQTVYVWDKSRKWASWYEILKKVRAVGYDVVVNLHRFASTGLFTYFAKAKQTLGFDINPVSRLYHKRVPHLYGTLEKPILEVERYLKTIEHLTDSSFVRPRLYPSAADYEHVKTDKKYVCMAPASIWETKKISMKRWITLTNRMPDDIVVYLIGSKADIPLCEAIKAASQHPQIEIKAGVLSLLESAALMQHAQMNYTHDSAPMHITSAMNAPVVEFYCSTAPVYGFIPLSDNSHYVETKEDLACRPCGLHGHRRCPKGHFKCGEIDVETMDLWLD